MVAFADDARFASRHSCLPAEHAPQRNCKARSVDNVAMAGGYGALSHDGPEVGRWPGGRVVPGLPAGRAAQDGERDFPRHDSARSNVRSRLSRSMV